MEKILVSLTKICHVLTILMIVNMNSYHKNKSLHIIRTHTTDTVIQTVYRDTCDSQFMKAILQNECGYMNEVPTKNVIGDGGKAYGIYGMHAIYLKVTNIPDLLDYSHEDMFDHAKAHRVFWAVTGAYAYRYYRESGKMPTFEQLAQMHNGGYEGRDRAKQYLIKFKKYFYGVK